MRVRLLAAWYLVRRSYWFLPALLAAAAVGLSALTIAIDDGLRDRALGGLAWVYAGGPDGARALLSTIASSTITVTALVFSITMVVLSQASAQLGPRLLTLFMRDTGNQLVLGTFVATFMYCMLVLRTVRADPLFVPHVSVTVAITLAVAGLAVLIYFIHHTAVSIQADTVIAAVAQDLDQAIDHLYPEELGEEPARGDGLRAEVPAAFPHEARPVSARGSGYIRAVDTDGLMALATERDLLVQLLYRPGHFVVLGGTVARVWPPDRVDEPVSERVAGVFLLGRQRTLEQDVEFAVNQLVEIALRALSPGINDPFTAITCVDRLGAALRRLAQRAMPSRYRCDGAGALRVVADVVNFEGAVDAAFDQIRQAARANVAVTVRLLETIAVVQDGTRRPEDLETLQRHASMIWRGAATAVVEPGDRAAIEARYLRLTKPGE